ncbi:MAG: citrate synthase [Candidatus Magnetomorum sp.]|nr:citrate synthase [Candidatus Magnetomorum sp.]
MEETVKLIIENKTMELPVIYGSEGERGIDISTLRQETGFVTMDPGFRNTGSCTSCITYIDGKKGIMRYRGIPIEELAEMSTFRETVYLLVNGVLPTIQEVEDFSTLLNEHSMVHEDMQTFYQNFPRYSHPMGILSSMVNALQSFYPSLRASSAEEQINMIVTRLISKVRTLTAMSYKISRGHKVVYPRSELSYCENFLNMLFDTPVKPYVIDSQKVTALSKFLIVHADHEQNCSTAAVRMVGSGRVNLYAAISAGISALWGRLHGGGIQAVIEMLEKIQAEKVDVKQFIQRAKNPDNCIELDGFGHHIYETLDPRSKIMKTVFKELLETMNINDPLIDIALELEQTVLSDHELLEKNCLPNHYFYSSLVLYLIGIPKNMHTLIFAIGRLPGWIAQWKEGHDDPKWKIARPRQIYIGPTVHDYVPMSERKEN